MSMEQTATASATEELQGPPLPKWAYGIVNPVLKTILRSPFHNPISKDLMLLSYTGRKSGKRYSIPVGYYDRGDRLVVFTHSPWWKNFRDGAPVSVRLRGQNRRATATLLEDPEVINQVVRTMVERRGEQMARRMGVITGEQHNGAYGPPHPGTKFIEIRLLD